MKKILSVHLLIILTFPVFANAGIRELQSRPIMRSVVGIVARMSYPDSAEVHREVRPFRKEPTQGTVLKSEQLDLYFHDEERKALLGFKNTFETMSGVKGCIYSVNCEELSKKIFIAFPGTQSLLEWAKNFFGIEHFQNNVQSSYWKDVQSLRLSTREGTFWETLYRHINFINSGYEVQSEGGHPENLTEYEYYFIGHSRGGGLAFLSGKLFKESFSVEGSPSVKIVTFNSPKLTNAHLEQLRFVEALGFSNIIHFARPWDIAPTFPFRFVENYGVKVPLTANSFWFIRHSHRIPDEEEIDQAIISYNTATEIGWRYPLRQVFTMEPKALLWGIGGAGMMCFFLKSGASGLFSINLRDLAFRILLKI